MHLLVMKLMLVSCLILAAGAQAATVNVRDYGAAPDDGSDDTPAVRKALEEAARTQNARLVFPKGRYDFRPEEGRGTLFTVDGAKGLTIDGEGSEFVVHGVVGLFSFSNCTDLSVSGFTLDYARPPFSVGRVIAAAGNHFDVDVYPEYPVKGGEPVGAFMDWDPETRMYVRHGLDEYYTATGTELLRPQVLRVNLKHEARIRPGVWVVLRHQVYGPAAVWLGRCVRSDLRDITIYTVPGMGLIGDVCTDITLDRFNVYPRDGRQMSATADATHFSGCKGTITITNSRFEGMGDDAANIKSGLYLSVKRREDARTVLAAHNLKMRNVPDPGDRMELSHVQDLIPYATLTVKSAEALPGEDGLHRVTFEEDLPEGLKETDVLGNASRVPRLRVRNCRIGNNRARGMLVQTRDAIVENCNFVNCTSAGIMVLTEVVYFYESIGTRDVIVRNNRFVNCNYGGPLAEGVLGSFAYLKDFAYPPKPGVHANVRFENNFISGADNAAIFVNGTDGIVIQGNRIEQCCRMPTREDVGHSAIHISSSIGVVLEGNTVLPEKQGPAFREALTLGPGVEKDKLTLKDNKGF